MKNFSQIFWFQFRHMVTRRQFRLLFLFVVTVITLSFLDSYYRYYGMDIGVVPSPAMGWIGRTPNASGEQWALYVFAIFLEFFLLAVGALVFSDFYLTDQKEGTYPLLITRSSSNAYHLAGALVCFLGAFGMILLPLLLFYPITFVFFPSDAIIYPFLSTRSFLDLSRVKDHAVLFPNLFYSHPHLSNLVFIFYNSLLAGAWALVSYTLSYFLKFSRILVIVLPTVFLLFGGYVYELIMEKSIALIQYTNPTWFRGDRYLAVFWAYLLIPLLFSVLVITLRLRKRKADEL
ncbi:hypothetical protein [Clostridium minihomine]|uniref:hypothetical protein n=1 Tax=Clostridium minihomine TaxID=2045012 RepID=UPI000C768C22|nr:hypothetical protein [Clostridium minihomine]